MLKLITVFIIFLSLNFSSKAENIRPTICYTNGECVQRYNTSLDDICFNIYTGLDASGKATCAYRCTEMPVSYICEKFEGKIFGKCVKEPIYATISFPGDCKDSIDPDEAP